MIRDIRDECQVEIKMVFVKSEKNKADTMTRVPKHQLEKTKKKETCAVGATTEQRDLIASIHNLHHFGVDKTLYSVMDVIPGVDKKEVKDVVRSCVQCRSIDPSPVKWEKGHLWVDELWRRIVNQKGASDECEL